MEIVYAEIVLVETTSVETTLVETKLLETTTVEKQSTKVSLFQTIIQLLLLIYQIYLPNVIWHNIICQFSNYDH